LRQVKTSQAPVRSRAKYRKRRRSQSFASKGEIVEFKKLTRRAMSEPRQSALIDAVLHMKMLFST
jgi:hypothetical protein